MLQHMRPPPTCLQACDRIYVLREGIVAEQGSHAQLLAKGGLYREMWRLQEAEQVGKEKCGEVGPRWQACCEWWRDAAECIRSQSLDLFMEHSHGEPPRASRSPPFAGRPQAVDSICSHDADDASIDGPLPGTKEEELWREGWREGWQQGLEEGQAVGEDGEELAGGPRVQVPRSIAPTATP